MQGVYNRVLDIGDKEVNVAIRVMSGKKVLIFQFQWARGHS